MTLRVIHISITAWSEQTAAGRIKRAQRESGLDVVSVALLAPSSGECFMLDKNVSIATKKRRFYERLDSIPVRLSPGRRRDLPWSTGWTGRRFSTLINRLRPDVVNFHWLTNGLVDLFDIRRIDSPVVFTLHDVWAVTGGCHCNLGCDLWSTGCHRCPQLGRSVMGFEFAPILRQRKLSAYAKVANLSVVTPSRWLADMTSQSKTFDGRKVSVIPNCLDISLFRPGDLHLAKRQLGLSSNAFVIGFGAVEAISTSYKGYDLLVAAMGSLRERGVQDVELVVFGADKSDVALPYPAKFLGHIDSEIDMARIYNAMDLYVTPSRQDNFPGTVVEATACGTPVVAFDIGGMSDLVRHCVSGYLAIPFDVRDLADGIEFFLRAPDKLASAGKAAADFTSFYCAPDYVASKYRQLYDSVIKGA